MTPPLPRSLQWLAARLPAGSEPWLVGGAVRDLLLGRPLGDLDLAVASGGLELARRLADSLGAAYVPLDLERGVGRVVWERDGRRLEVDIADFRAGDLEGDLRSRDLSINAMALRLDGVGGLVDPTGGRADLAAGLVRVLSAAVLDDDPLRGLRAVRIAAQLGFRLDPRSRQWIAERAGALAAVAAERVRDELWKCLVAPAPAATLRQLDELGLLGVIMPETRPAHGLVQSPPRRQDVWEHTLSVVEQTSRVVELVRRLAEGGGGADPGLAAPAAMLLPFAAPLADRLAQPLAANRQAYGHLLLVALLHDLGKAAVDSPGEDGRIPFDGHERVGADLAEQRLLALRLAQAEVHWVARAVRQPLRPLQLLGEGPLSGRAIHRFHRAAGEVAPEVCLLALADHLAAGEERMQGSRTALLARLGELLDAFFCRHQQLVSPPPLLRGGELVAAFGLAPGPVVGELLRALVEAQAAGEVQTREQGSRFAGEWLRRRAGRLPAAPTAPSGE